MTDICTKDVNFKWHHGKLGGYLQDKNQGLYGITCRHVTQVASDGIIYIMNKKVIFGKTLKRNKKYICGLSEDIDLFLINEEMQIHCDKSLRDSNGELCPVSVYEEPIGILYGQRVFMRGQDGSAYQVVHVNVASAEDHHQLQESMVREVHFLIEPTSSLKPGDSGNILCVDNRNNISIVGIILAGKVKLHNKEYVLCMRFNHGIKLLEKIYDRDLRLPDEFRVMKTNHENLNLSVQIGTCIWVKWPEDVAKTDFVLFEHLIMLIECFTDKFSVSTASSEIAFEDQLSRHVSNRNQNIHLMQCTSSSEKCILECMIGCEYLYSGNFEKSDEHLKDAVRLISKTVCRNRLLCKLITYSTWQLLKTDNLCYMKELLDKGEVYLLQMKDCNACPLKSIGYLFFDSSRYFYRLQDYQKAMEMARKSLEYFEYDEKYRSTPTYGKCFALSMIARLNLMCGYNFETRQMPVIDIDEAHQSLKDMKRFGVLPEVEKSTYWLIKTDYHYRRGEMEKAIKTAKKCYHLAAKNQLKEELCEATIRIKELCKMSNGEKKD